MKRLEIGVFLPVGKNGFLYSSNASPYVPSFRDNLEITLLTEEVGLDYVFSMAKWRGFGGKTHFWDSSLESFSLMAALAASTERVRLIATVNPLLFHPALMAKMAATVDDVCGGRLGLNLITGSTLGEYGQMGVLPESYDENRYAYATEWVQVLKRLWLEPSVTYHGEYFQLEDCVSEPKPIQRPHPFLVCAATSDEGLRFTAQEADCSFVNGKDVAQIKNNARRSRMFAEEEGRTVKVAVPATLILRDSKVDADAYWEHLVDGADVDAMSNAGIAYSGGTRTRNKERGAELLTNKRRIASHPVIGGPSEIANELISLALEGEVDDLLLQFPDYIDGLQRFRDDVLPLLRKEFDVGLTGVEDTRDDGPTNESVLG